LADSWESRYFAIEDDISDPARRLFYAAVTHQACGTILFEDTLSSVSTVQVRSRFSNPAKSERDSGGSIAAGYFVFL
jgi:hypothetical protein